ncbi:MAG: YebC/PmpR family DNA-binding transcriptional regulator [Alphaproteobacteria bacterium]
MAGHSKFKNIQHRKGAQDAKRAKFFTKLAREITVASRLGGPDPDSNARLRAGIIAARQQNMPKDNIDRAVKKGSGPAEGENYEEMRYEGFGPGAVSIIVEALTDNKNRTAADVRSTYAKYGGNMGETGSVSFGFEHCGRVAYPASVADSDAFFEAALEVGADDVQSSDDEHEAFCSIEDFNNVRDGLEKVYGEANESKIIWKPNNLIEVSEGHARTLLKLIDMLEDNDDVQTVTCNFDISDEIMEILAAE